MHISDLIIQGGYIGIFLVIFAESGFFLGFFLPGDSLLFTAGILASQHIFNIYYLIIGCIICAIAGDSLGYFMGYYFGHKLVKREKPLIKEKHIKKTEEFFQKYGKKTIILARFVPIVRTFAPILAGVGDMKYSTFITYNVIGGVLWTLGFLSLAYYLGTKFVGIQHYLTYIIILIIIVSILPIAIDFLKKKR